MRKLRPRFPHKEAAGISISGGYAVLPNRSQLGTSDACQIYSRISLTFPRAKYVPACVIICSCIHLKTKTAPHSTSDVLPTLQHEKQLASKGAGKPLVGHTMRGRQSTETNDRLIMGEEMDGIHLNGEQPLCGASIFHYKEYSQCQNEAAPSHTLFWQRYVCMEGGTSLLSKSWLQAV